MTNILHCRNLTYFAINYNKTRKRKTISNPRFPPSDRGTHYVAELQANMAGYPFAWVMLAMVLLQRNQSVSCSAKMEGESVIAPQTWGELLFLVIGTTQGKYLKNVD